MKILYIITKSSWGGAQRHVYDLAVAMKGEGHEVAVALGGEGTLKDRLEAAGIFTHSIGSLGRDISAHKDAGSFKEVYSLIRHRKPDIIHLHSPKAAGLGALAGRLARVPKIIYTVHGWAFNEPRPFHERALIAFLSWITMLLCHTVILLSECERAQAARFPGVENKLVRIPLGITPPTFMSIDGARQTIAKSIGLDPVTLGKHTLVGTIAELHPNKGLSYLVEAMASVIEKYPQTLCVIIGDGQEKASLHLLIKEKKLEGVVHLAGYLDNASEYLKALNVFVLPSVKEGFPYVILEAGAASLPVVSTTVGGIPEMIGDMKSGILIQPKNVRELAHAISFMIEHPEERRNYGATLREKVLKEFSLEKMLTEIEKTYESV